VYETLLRRLTANGLRKGMRGSTPWMILAIVAGGLRVIRYLARDGEEVLYRTKITPGDVFEVVTRPKK
jgi:hypothetical protein